MRVRRPETEQAMNTLGEFSRREHRYEDHRARLDGLLLEGAIRRDPATWIVGGEWERLQAPLGKGSQH